MLNPLILLTLALVLVPPKLAPSNTDSLRGTVSSYALGSHEDSRIGFKISTPKKWNQIPIQNSEQWIVGRYQSDKSNYFSDKTSGATYEHKPEMTMIAFTGDGLDADIDLGQGQVDGRTVSRVFRFLNPYKDYQEYLKKTYSGGGWFIDKEVEKEVHGIPVTAYEIKVEKSSWGGPKHITTWVFHLGHADVAVQFECLEKAYPKLRKTFESRLKTFTAIERTETKEASSFGIKEIFNDADTPEKRKELRLTIEKEQHALAIANLPADWTFQQTDRFLVLSHVKKKHTKDVLRQIEAMFDWLEDVFPYVGAEEYVRRPIIRICQDREEMNVFRSSSGWSFTNIEILTCRDTGVFSTYFRGAANDRTFRYWFDERDRELYRRLPAWLKKGMDRMMHSARAKGKRLIFDPDEWENTGLREALRDGTITLPSQMFRLTNEDFRDNETLYRECGAFVRYLLAGKGAKSKMTKGLVEDYLKNLRAILDEEEALENDEDDEEDDDEPMTEEEEDTAFKDKQNYRKERDQDLADAVFERTFADWTHKDWDALDKAYLRSVK